MRHTGLWHQLCEVALEPWPSWDVAPGATGAQEETGMEGVQGGGGARGGRSGGSTDGAVGRITEIFCSVRLRWPGRQVNVVSEIKTVSLK